MLTPIIANKITSGTTSMTESGSVQLSYNAESSKNTNITHTANMYMEEFPAFFCWYARSVHSMPIPCGRIFAASFSISPITYPVLYPWFKFP